AIHIDHAHTQRRQPREAEAEETRAQERLGQRLRRHDEETPRLVGEGPQGSAEEVNTHLAVVLARRGASTAAKWDAGLSNATAPSHGGAPFPHHPPLRAANGNHASVSNRAGEGSPARAAA